jgi:UDP-glucuronate decarboxylase
VIDEIIREDIEKIESRVKGEFFEEKDVLVTGGAGFIGSWLCDVLLHLGANVTGLDDFSTGRLKNIDHLRTNAKFKLIKSDVCKFKSKEKFDIILHMAGHASPDEYQAHPIETLQTSAVGTKNMAELSLKNDATLLFASTSEVYGDAEVIPTPESYWGRVNPIGPRSCYDEGKRFAEALLMAYSKHQCLDVRVPRIFNSYGPRLREDGLYGRAMSRFVLQALTNQPITVYGNGTQTRSFCYVTDTIAALILLTTDAKAKGEVVNVGNDQEITILELAKEIKRLTKSKSEIEFHPSPNDDPKRRRPDTTRLQKLTGWRPEIALEKGLERTATWFSRTLER